MKKESNVGFFYLKIFITFAVLVFVISVVIKVGYEFVNSTFKYDSYSLLYVTPNDTKIISVNKKAKTYSFYSLGNVRDYLKGKSIFETSVFLRIPVYSIIVDPHDAPFSNKSSFLDKSNELSLIFSPGDKIYKKINNYDIYQLMGVARGVPNDNKTDGKVDVFDDKANLQSFFLNFKDPDIQEAPYTVEVINGTSINGFGTQVANLLTTVGFNIISVTSNTGAKQNSFISTSVASEKYIGVLRSLTGFELNNRAMSKASDVTVYLGKDLE